jgi:hypothetical protein
MEQSIAFVLQEREILRTAALDRVQTSLKALLGLSEDSTCLTLAQHALSQTLLAKYGGVNDGQRDAVIRILLRHGVVSHWRLAVASSQDIDALVRQYLYLLEA